MGLAVGGTLFYFYFEARPFGAAVYGTNRPYQISVTLRTEKTDRTCKCCHKASGCGVLTITKADVCKGEASFQHYRTWA